MTKRILLGALAALATTTAGAAPAQADTAAPALCADYSVLAGMGGEGTCVRTTGITRACVEDTSALEGTEVCARVSLFPTTAIPQLCYSVESSALDLDRREGCQDLALPDGV